MQSFKFHNIVLDIKKTLENFASFVVATTSISVTNVVIATFVVSRVPRYTFFAMVVVAEVVSRTLSFYLSALFGSSFIQSQVLYVFTISLIDIDESNVSSPQAVFLLQNLVPSNYNSMNISIPLLISKICSFN